MTLEQLRVFIAVAEREHVTRAAEALGLTQSAVSAAIASLEAQYGVALFDRVGRRIELNREGRMFLGEARAVLSRAAAAELALTELGGLERGTLSIRASRTIASYWLPLRLAAFRRAHPRIDVRLAVGDTAQVAKAVAEGEAELGFAEARVDDPQLEQRVIDRDRFVVAVAPDHRWASRDALSPDDLREGGWVMRERGSVARSDFEAVLSERGIDARALKAVLELPSDEAMCAAVEAGAGAAAMSALVAAPGLRAGTLKIAPFALVDRLFHTMRHRERYCSRAGRVFLDLIAGREPERDDRAG